MPHFSRFSVDEVLDVLYRFYAYRWANNYRSDFADVELEAYDEWIETLGVGKRRKLYLKFFKDLCRLFECKYVKQNWIALADDKTPMIRIAKLISASAERRSIKPVAVLGSRCARAGIFLDLCTYLSHSAKSDFRVAPSSPISTTLTTELQNQLAYRIRSFFPTAEKTPNLWHESKVGNVAGVLLIGVFFGTATVALLAFVGAILSGIASFLTPSWLESIRLLFAAVGSVATVVAGIFSYVLLLALPVVIVAIVLAIFANTGKGPFDGSIKTFRDLVERIAVPHCESCGYNLTGLTEHRCPECGGEVDSPLLDLRDLSLTRHAT